MSKKIGVAVIGSGRIGHSHLSAIKELSNITELIATVDKVKEIAQESAKKFEAKRYYTSLSDALKDPEIDAVIICLPHYLHTDACIEAAEMGKHILVEKPLAITFKDAQKIVETGSKNNIILMVGQSQRFFDAVMESKRIFDSGKIGDIVNISVSLLGYMDKPVNDWWADEKKTGGLLIPLWGSHIIDHILWLSGKFPRRIYAETYSRNPLWEGEDEASILLGYEDGTMASIIMSYNAHTSNTEVKGYLLPLPRFHTYIIGTRGTLHLEGTTKLYLNEKILFNKEQKQSIFHNQMKEFITSILEEKKPLASGEEVLKVIQVMEASSISAKEHRLIEF
jgi:predicted dehydrogenase